jgi:Trypsin-co-occurring domain 2
MSMQNEVSLKEVINKIKLELLTPDSAGEAEPMFSVDSVSIELKVEVKKEGKAGLQIHVLQAGGSIATDTAQTIKVTLSPLLTKEERIRLFQEQNPGQWAKVQKSVVKATLKGRK